MTKHPQFSLRRLICVVLTTAFLFALTFRMPAGSYSGNAKWGGVEILVVSKAGFPFENYRTGSTWGKRGEDFSMLERLYLPGIAGNLLFWLLFCCGLLFAIAKVAGRSELNQRHLRSFFQIHLSTAIVLMFVAAFVLWANVTPNLFFSIHHYGNITGMGADYYGYPFCVYSTTGFDYDPAARWPTRILLMLLNIFCTLAPSAIITEYLVRRSESYRETARLIGILLSILVFGFTLLHKFSCAYARTTAEACASLVCLFALPITATVISLYIVFNWLIARYGGR